MARAREDQRQLYRCTSPFAVYRGRVPVVYSADDEVLDDDPILATHSHLFERANERALKRARFEQATAAPNELRHVTTRPEEEPPRG